MYAALPVTKVACLILPIPVTCNPLPFLPACEKLLWKYGERKGELITHREAWGAMLLVLLMCHPVQICTLMLVGKVLSDHRQRVVLTVVGMHILPMVGRWLPVVEQPIYGSWKTLYIQE